VLSFVLPRTLRVDGRRQLVAARRRLEERAALNRRAAA
jgi:hypothetical protein